ncbi:MAG TPA: POTRA domain-containing protein [Bacteroidia bacterium]|nr:POTRA domain-containing protein [Bacteroidia bacterium]
MRLVVLAFSFLFFSELLPGQKLISLEIIETGNENALRNISYKKTFPNKAEREKELHNVLTALWNQSWLAAHYDSIRQDSILLTAWLSPGQKHKWARIGKGNVEEGILSETGNREKVWRNRPLRYREVAALQENILDWCENHGYPFAIVRLDSVRIEGDATISAQLFLQKNRFTKIDSIEQKGNLKLSKPYLHNYIGISPGDPYDQSKLDVLTKRLRELPFARETQPYTLLFTEKFTKLTLHLDKKRAGQFDGIVGFLPDSRTGKILFTGDARLRLHNSFGHGELIELNWRRLKEQTQDLTAGLKYPYLFRTPVGVFYKIKLYRRDTTFIDVQQTLGLDYLFSAHTSLSAFVKRRNSNLLSTYGLENTTVLPSFADIATSSYGLSFHHSQYDYRFNPRRGFGFTITGDIGNRLIRKNAKINPVVYDNLNLRSVQYGGELTADRFWPFGRRSTIKSGVQAAWIYNNTVLFRNELFRIGGLKTLRGFDEESIFASAYAIGTLEYRFLLEENSWLFIFADGCWYESNSKDNFTTGLPFGFGTGVTFETKAGIFAMTYALGSQFGQTVSFRAGKIHVGFVGLF